MKLGFDRALTLVLVTCAIITTGLVAYRVLFAPATSPAIAREQKPVFIPDWKSHLGTGVRLGPSDAPVQLMEFADFECPFCASFHQTLKTIRNRHHEKVALWYFHYPLPMHRFAEPAARVAECAGKQERFEAMHDRLFEQQAKLGVKPWSEFAAETGIDDLVSFDSCIKDEAPMRRISEGRRVGDQLSIQGTPTLIINGWKLSSPPSEKELERMVKAVLAGKSPVSEGA